MVLSISAKDQTPYDYTWAETENTLFFLACKVYNKKTDAFGP
ncbi:hypothetical protein [Candidatus Nitrosocosmicus sp. R]